MSTIPINSVPKSDLLFGKYYIQRWQGTIIESSMHSETHVSGGGGGGAYGVYNVNAVSSKVVNVKHFWLRTDDGQEIELSISDENVSARTGQRVTVYAMGMQNKKHYTMRVMAMHNRTMKTRWIEDNILRQGCYTSMPARSTGGMWMAILWVIATAFFIINERHIADALGASFILAFLLYIPSALITKPKIRARRREVLKWLESEFAALDAEPLPATQAA